MVTTGTAYSGKFPVFWRGECATLPGDFEITDTLPDGTFIPQGTPVKLDFANNQCSICKSARVVAGGTTTAPRVLKRQGRSTLIQVGDTVKVGADTATVSAIDKTNADYDVLTLSAAIAGAVEGADILTNDNIPNGVVETGDFFNPSNGYGTVSVGYNTRVLSEVAYPMPDAWLQGGYCLTDNHEIKYIRQ